VLYHTTLLASSHECEGGIAGTLLPSF
jgi:hypothetical protein